ncbi:MAG: serine/threonine-protein kinase [Isosphaeraceae bacterium]
MSQGSIGERLGSFRLDEPLGSGAMGVVYKATHEPTGRVAAIKIMHAELGQKGKVYERFEREAEILKQLNHPNIVRWLAWGRYKGTSYFAMEYIEGQTLERILQDRGDLPWREAVDLSIQLCDALQAAHDRNVIHRDLKPSNLMIARDGTLKLSDFGIAKDLDRTTQLTAPGRTLGTAAFMAPEQIRGTPAVSHKTDLYALGVLLHQMLTGKAPFEGTSAVMLMHNHLNQEPPRPSQTVQEIPKELDDLVLRLMAKSPADRPWDAAAVGHELRELREKDRRGDAIKMVWPEKGSGPVNPSRLGVPAAPGRPRKKARKGGTLATLSSRLLGRDRDADGEPGGVNWALLEVIGMVVALVAIGGFIGYWVWPPSAEYLHRHAEELMASKRRSDWLTARDEYFDPLEKRFPDHPYKEQVRKWRDHIVLEDARSRAEVLSSRLKVLSEPQNNGERQYASFEAQATQAAAEGNEVQALSYWKEMAGILKADDPADRPWHLLALERAAELQRKISDRHAHVVEQLVRATTFDQQGRPAEARAIRDRLTRDYGRYTEVRPLLEAAAGPRPNDQAAPEGAEKPAPAPGDPDRPSPGPAGSPKHGNTPGA